MTDLLVSHTVDYIRAREVKEVSIKSNVGNTSLEVLPTDIIYIESMSNYAIIYYIADNET